jgi:hypothetical protein
MAEHEPIQADGQAETVNIAAVEATLRAIGETAFSDCDVAGGVCKFGYDEVAFCDRLCDVPVWEQI